MTITVKAFDAAEYLDSPEMIAAYLDTMCEDGTVDEIASALGDVARAIGMNKLAEQVGLTGPGIRKALSGNGNPSLSTLVKVSEALGVQLSFKPAVPKKITQYGPATAPATAPATKKAKAKTTRARVREAA